MIKRFQERSCGQTITSYSSEKFNVYFRDYRQRRRNRQEQREEWDVAGPSGSQSHSGLDQRFYGK